MISNICRNITPNHEFFKDRAFLLNRITITTLQVSKVYSHLSEIGPSQKYHLYFILWIAHDLADSHHVQKAYHIHLMHRNFVSDGCFQIRVFAKRTELGLLKLTSIWIYQRLNRQTTEDGNQVLGWWLLQYCC